MTVDVEAGRIANLTGKQFEQTVEQRLQQVGFIKWNGSGEEPNKWYRSQAVVGDNAIGARHKVDFLLSTGLIIECKWQASSGSVDEKYLWTVHNLDFSGHQSLLVMEGGGCRPAMLSFLKDLTNTQYTNVTILDLSEFFRYSL